MKQPLVVICGVTGCGKTAVSVEVCKNIGGEVISADSMQVYKGMDIGTAKVKEEETQGIKHYLIDVMNPDEGYSAALFKDMAMNAANEILNKGKIPVVVGGTGFYINALLYDNDFGDGERDLSVRQQLEKELAEKGADFLYNELLNIDPAYAKSIHKNNTKRVIRGLEFYRETGEKFSDHNRKERLNEPCFNHLIFILNSDRSTMYERIDRRVDDMIKNGLVDEVKGLLESGVKRSDVSMQGLGYKETAAYLCGEMSLEEAVYTIKRDTRHFAKRQMTWFKHQCKDGIWIDVGEFDNDPLKIAEYMTGIIGEKYGKN
ncbi:MAG: tRNA (adenosine(37)-N6)-dimethylallyltransferase MiaA [Eubacterium sp.]|nr:tRNA (adenosine(37)-N6)-dimethylallyltransferase MiaA [Eubacterium sp.]